MKIKIQYILISIVISFLCSQNLVAQQSNKDIIFKAMQDEMERSMNMSDKDYFTPNFISYTLMFQNSLKIVSQQGALFSSESRKYADGTWRLTIGDYQINDENFENKISSGGQDVFYEMATPPINPDYNGIRNVLWILTNYSYNTAAPNHKNKKELIEKHSLSEEDGLLPDFSREDVVEYVQDRASYTIDKSKLEEKTRLYSSVFKNYPDLKYAKSQISVIQNDLYYLNSEGSVVSYPMDLTRLVVSVKTDFSGENATSNSLSFIAKTPEDLPSDKEVIAEIDKLAQQLKLFADAENLNEEYSGPVLFEGNIVGDVFMANLFSFDFSLNARRRNLVVENYNKFYFEENGNKLQTKIGEQIFPDHLSITSYSTLEEFEGVKLMGAYTIDSEGVMPSDSMIMVEDGILKNLYSSRIPTTVSEQSTGSRRFTFNNNKIGFRRAPGSLYIRSNKGSSSEQLKSKLLVLAKEKGFEYAYIVRSIPTSIANLPANCYRVNVETGEETLINGAVLRYKLKAQVLKTLSGVSNTSIVYNTLFSGTRYQLNSINASASGLPLSLIIPSAILVDNADIRTRTQNKNLNSDLEVISNPLERKK